MITNCDRRVFAGSAVRALTAVIVVSGAGIAGCRNPGELPLPVQPLAHLEPEQARPVGGKILVFNPHRKAAGLVQVGPDWSIIPTNFVILDGPVITVLLNEQREPAKVILAYGLGRGVSCPRIQEYDIVDGKLSGKAATWRGALPLLFMVQTYEKNKLSGPTTYYAKDGTVICTCEFHGGLPWTGRVLVRHGFDRVESDVSYRQGKLHGQEWRYTQTGQPERLRTFKAGVRHGPQRQYQQRRLRCEEWCQGGVVRRRRSWHDNGQLQSEAEYDAAGRLTGVLRKWGPDGTLLCEMSYKAGRYHGRCWEEGRQEGWWWKGKRLGGGEGGKKQFDARLAKW